MHLTNVLCVLRMFYICEQPALKVRKNLENSLNLPIRSLSQKFFCGFALCPIEGTYSMLPSNPALRDASFARVLGS